MVEVPGPERIVEIEKPVEKIIEVPVEVIKEVIVPQRVIEVDKEAVKNIIKITREKNSLTEDNKKLKKYINELEQVVHKQPEIVEKIVEVPVEVEKAATGDLKHAARLLAQSEFNKEDLTVDQIFEILQKSSEDEVRKKIGFWAVPLPKQDPLNTTDKRYIGKK